LLVASTFSESATTVTVLELGKGGAVRRTSTEEIVGSSIEGVTSLWASVHGDGKHTGSLVADLFHKADEGIVMKIGEKAAKDVMKKAGKSVGALEVAGRQADHLLSKANVKTMDMSAQVEKEINTFLAKLHKEAEEKDETVVVHLISEDDTTPTRRLNDEDEEGDDNANANANANNGFYGYYNDYGEWVTNYRTIFQIQYYNVILWTTVGLVGMAYATNVMLVNMPLMEDTLLFGESAKMATS